MSELNSLLLYSDEISGELESSPLAGSGARGTYSPMQFVLRLRPDIQTNLKNIKPGVHTADELTDAEIQSYSTYLHENIHWWQHVGSNFGVLSSLRYPAQAHIAYKDLKKLLANEGAFKSIIKYDILLTNAGKSGSNLSVNNIINYWYDLNFAAILSLNPKSAKEIIQNPYFLSVGHSYHMMWRGSIMTIANSIDREFTFLPKIFSWNTRFDELKNQGVRGFKENDDVFIPPFGTKAIYEGQARFSQLQFLYLALGGRYAMDDFERQGMLNGIYVEAVDFYLKTIDEKMPESPTDSLIGLFLLVCDVAINPTSGFPFEIGNYDTFIQSVDPGHRFFQLCRYVKNNKRKFIHSVQKYDKEEYIKIGEALSTGIGDKSPYESCRHISENWTKQESIIELLREEEEFKYRNEDLAIRLFFSKFLRFQQDKFDQPQLFCWPGFNSVNLSGDHTHFEEARKKIIKHQALFVDDTDGEVVPALFDHYSDAQIDETFNSFYTWNCTYDMVRKWISESGPFTYEYSWLSNRNSYDDVKKWICHHFENLFGCSPDSFKIL